MCPATETRPGASGIDHIQKAPIVIDQSMPFTCAFGTVLGSSKSISIVVVGLYGLPATELILQFDVDYWHVHNARLTVLKKLNCNWNNEIALANSKGPRRLSL
jgi:hypothetical protein